MTRSYDYFLVTTDAADAVRKSLMIETCQSAPHMPAEGDAEGDGHGTNSFSSEGAKETTRRKCRQNNRSWARCQA